MADDFQQFMDADGEESKWEFQGPSTLSTIKQYEDIYYKNWRVEWKQELLYMPFAPKNPFSEFADKGGAIFMSKKRPLLIVCHLANEKETERALANINDKSFGYFKTTNEESKDPEVDNIQDESDSEEQAVKKKFLFKCGDDLR